MKKHTKTILISFAALLLVLVAFLLFRGFDSTAKYEAKCEKKALEVLETFMGKGNVNVQVSAEVVPKSSQSIVETYKDAPDGFLKETVYSNSPTLRRLSVGIVVNKVLMPSETAEIEALVESALGMDADRGDSIAISSFKFSEKPKNVDFVWVLLLLPFLMGIFLFLYFQKPKRPVVIENKPLELDYSAVEEPSLGEKYPKARKEELKEAILNNPEDILEILGLGGKDD